MSQYADRVIADGATNFWRLGETSGTTAVDVVGGKNGTISGGVTLAQPGALVDGDKAMTFNGVDGMINVAALPHPLAVTIEVWQKTAGGAGQQPSVRLGGATYTVVAVVNATTNQLILNGGIAGSGTSGGVPANQWNHLVYVCDGATVGFYVNGVFDRTQPCVRTADTGPVVLGFAGGIAAMLGSLDDVAIYPRALTAQEIAQHYSVGRSGFSGRDDLTTLINPYLATLTGDYTNRWKQMEKNAGLSL